MNAVLTNADLILLSELIPHMTCLKTLGITGNNVIYGDQDGLLKILQQLSHSNVTTLDIKDTGFCRLLRDSPHDFYSALKQLVCPSSGKLEELWVGDKDDDDGYGRLASLVFAPSSLKSLKLYYTSLSGHVSSLKKNTCLTKLTLWHHDWSEQAPHNIAHILEHNKTLQHLELNWLFKHNIDAVRTIVLALPGNNTLKSIELHILDPGHSLQEVHDPHEVSRYMRTHHEELTLDPRIHYK